MTALLALPVALVLGGLADLVAGIIGRRRPWWGSIASVARDLRGARGPDRRPDAVTAGGSAAALLGASLAAGGALGVSSGSAVLVYLGLAAAAGGVHVATHAGDDATSRLQSAAAEPAFVAAFGVALLRWRATDLEAVQGTQAVLGPGIRLGPDLVLTGLVAAATILLVAGALRIGEPSGEDRGATGVLATAARWSAVGATALVAATLVAGSGVDIGLDPGRSALLLAAGGGAAAVVHGAALAAAEALPRGWPRYAAGLVALLIAAGAAWLVATR
ncbi:MAG: hypothetical protein ACRDH8_04430 [Actinomycetota bacterium]